MTIVVGIFFRRKYISPVEAARAELPRKSRMCRDTFRQWLKSWRANSMASLTSFPTRDLWSMTTPMLKFELWFSCFSRHKSLIDDNVFGSTSNNKQQNKKQELKICMFHFIFIFIIIFLIFSELLVLLAPVSRQIYVANDAFN